MRQGYDEIIGKGKVNKVFKIQKKQTNKDKENKKIHKYLNFYTGQIIYS